MEGYEILDKLGQGGMGVVYRARQKGLDREIALKLLIDGHGPPSAAELTRFGREVRALARMSHPNVVRVLDYGQMDGRPFYAMELIRDAEPLNRVMRTGPLPLPVVVSIARQLLHALAAIHAQRLIHRDLKPGNVMMDKTGHVTLMDFGLVKDADASKLTRTGTTIGTPRYLSPEAMQGKPVDARADLWALGVMLHEALVGRHLFHGDSILTIAVQVMTATVPPVTKDRPDCPQWLAELVSKLLEKEPEARTPSAAAALAQVHRSLGEGDPDLDPDQERVEPESRFDLPESRVIAGLDILEEGIASHDPGASTSDEDSPTLHSPPPTSPSPPPPSDAPPTPSPRPRASPQRRTLSVPVAAPAPPAPRFDPLKAAVVLGAMSAAILLIVLLMLYTSGQLNGTLNRGLVAPSGRSATAPTPSASTTSATATAHQALRSIRTLNPRLRIADLHAALQKIAGKWFKTPPHPSMLALRESFTTSMRAHLTAASLEPSLRALAAGTRPHFHTLTAADRLDVYLALTELEDLESYCETFGVPFPKLARPAFPPDYGMLAVPRLPDAPAVGFSLLDTSNNTHWIPPADPASGRWRISEVRHPMRFHDQGAGAEESDMMRTLGEGHQKNLTFEPGAPLDVPLDRCDALELSGYISDLFPNARFEFDLSDGSGFRTVAVVKLDTIKPQRWHHTVERELFRGAQLKLRARYRVLPDMSTGREFSHLLQVQLHYRVR